MGQTRAKKKRRRNHDYVGSFAFGSPTGRRSRVWKVWVPQGKTDVYMDADTKDAKISLHDPAESRGGQPWRFAFTKEHVDAGAAHILGAGDPKREIASWGPVGELPAEVVPMVQVIVPESELCAPLDHPLEDGGKGVTWLDAPEDDGVGYITLYNGPGELTRFYPTGKIIHAERPHVLPNGRVLFVVASHGPSDPLVTAALNEAKGRARKIIFDGVAADADFPFVEDGPNTLSGVQPLQTVRRSGRTMQVLLEYGIASFQVLS